MQQLSKLKWILVVTALFVIFELKGQTEKQNGFSDYINMSYQADTTGAFLEQELLTSYQTEKITPLLRSAFNSLESGAVDIALAGFRQLSKRPVQSEIIWYGMGSCFFKNSQTDSAIFYLKRSISINQKYGPAHLLLGQIYLNQNDVNKAHDPLNYAKKYMPNRPEPSMFLAVLYCAKSDFYLGKELALSALKIDSTYLPALVLAGRIETQMQHEKNAIEFFTRALEIDSAFIDALQWRMFSYLSQRNLKASMADVSRLIKLDSFNGFFYLIRSQLHFENRNYDSLVLDIEKYKSLPSSFNLFLVPVPTTISGADCNNIIKYMSEEIRTGQADPLLIESVAQLLQQNVEAAKTKLTKFIKKNPTVGFAYYIKGVILELEYDYIRAFENYELSTIHEPFWIDAYIRKGELALSRLNDLNKVETTFLDLLTVDDDNYLAYKYLSALYIHKEMPELALKYVNQAFSINPGNEDILYYKSQAHKMLGEQTKYRAYLELAALRKQGDHRLWFELTDLALQEGDSTKALTYLNEGLKYEIYASSRWSQKAQLLCFSGDYEQAAKDFEQALLYSRGNVNVILSASRCLYDQARYNDALAKLATILREDERNPEPYILRGLCWLGLGKKDEAIKLFNIAKELGHPESDRYIGMVEN